MMPSAITTGFSNRTINLSGWSFTNFAESGDTLTITGSNLNDTITGSVRNDLIIGGGLGDTLAGGDGDDVFRYTAGDATTGETVDGGNGTNDTLQLFSGSHDFRAVSIANVEALDFSGTAAATGHFAGAHVGGPNGIQRIDGSTFINNLIVSGTSVDLSLLTFSNWSANDTVTVNGLQFEQNTLVGSSLNDTINGGDFEDDIRGGLGADTLNGGHSNDVFRYVSGLEVESGEAIDGGLAFDTLSVTGDPSRPSTFDFRLASITGIEKLEMNGSIGLSRLLSTQIGDASLGRISQIEFVQSGFNTVRVDDTFIDLRGLEVSGQLSRDLQVIRLKGSSSDDIHHGSVAGDTFSFDGGADQLFGYEGDDLVFGASGLPRILIFNFDGGGGNDKVFIQSFDFTDMTSSTISNTETLSLNANGTLKCLSSQFSNSNFTKIENVAASAELVLQIEMSADDAFLDMAEIQFTGWDPTRHLVLINGSVNDDVVRSTIFRDEIHGGDGADSFDGTSGIDHMFGDGGDDTFLLDRAANHIEAGETIDGGADFDRIFLGEGDHDFRSVTVNSIERLAFFATSGTSKAVIDSAQIGTGFAANMIIQATPLVTSNAVFEVRCSVPGVTDLSEINPILINWQSGHGVNDDRVLVFVVQALTPSPGQQLTTPCAVPTAMM